MANHSIPQQGAKIAAKGRGGDTILAHLTRGEVSIPPQVMNEALANHIEQAFKAKGIDPMKFVAGSPAQSVNPSTGQPEFSFWTSIRNFGEKAVGAALGTALGGPVGGAIGAGLVGGVQGDRGIGLALDAVGGGFGGGDALSGFQDVGNSLVDAAGGVGTFGAGQTVGGALSGLGSSISNGLSSAGSGISNFISDPAGTIGSAASSVGNGISGLFGGSTPATSLQGFTDPGMSSLTASGANMTSPLGAGASGAGMLSTGSAYAAPSASAIDGLQGFGAPASGVLASSAAPASGIGSMLSGAKSYAPLLSAAGNIYSGYAGNQAASTMGKDMLQGTNNALAQQASQFAQTQANMAPYQATGAAATGNLGQLLSGDPATQEAALQATPGYQFNLDQGTKAMNQTLGAKGSLFSGDALKAAQTFGQGLADNTYNTAVAQNQNAANSGQSAALGLGSLGAQNSAANSQLLTDQGNISAQTVGNQQNATNQSLSNLLGLNQYDIYGRPLRVSAFGGMGGNA